MALKFLTAAFLYLSVYAGGVDSSVTSNDSGMISLSRKLNLIFGVVILKHFAAQKRFA